MNFGRELLPPGTVCRELDNAELPEDDPPEPETLPDELERMKTYYEIVRNRLAEGFQRQSHTYNLRHRPYQPRVGQRVYRRTQMLSKASKNFSAKLAPKYEGPFTISRVISPNLVMLQTPGSRRLDRVHVKDLKLTPPDVDETEGR